MRQSFLEVKTEAEARDEAPWAAEIIPVEGGFRVFESVTDADLWKNQV